MRWSMLAASVLAHGLLSWGLLALAGESDLTRPLTFVYFYMTTATTVGYGDLSPQGDLGRWITVFFVMTGGIALFTSVIAKVITGISTFWRRNMEGRGDYAHLEGATVIIGHHPSRTRRMIDEVYGGGTEAGKLILMTQHEMDSPDDRVHYIRAESLTSESDLRRAGVADAARVIVYANSDEQTLTAALGVAALNPDAHLVAYFSEAQPAQLLKKHAKAECVVSPSVELVVRAMQDPGASRIMSALSSTTENATVYSLTLPEQVEVSYGRAGSYLRKTKAANLIAAMTPQDSQPVFNADPESRLTAGSKLYFIRDRRLNGNEIDWQKIAAEG